MGGVEATRCTLDTFPNTYRHRECRLHMDAELKNIAAKLVSKDRCDTIIIALVGTRRRSQHSRWEHAGTMVMVGKSMFVVGAGQSDVVVAKSLLVVGGGSNKTR